MDNDINNNMDNGIVDFLIRAKKATYAGGGAEAGASRPGSHDLQYVEGSLKYIDTYVGSSKFAGEEALWKDDVPFWAMNYVGKVTGEAFSGDFLKEALLHVPEERPFRGPSRYTNGDYTYTCEITGGFHWFNGIEEIRHKGDKIYECAFHGGDVE